MTNMTIDAEIAVIGGGMSGCCAALSAARQGRSVVLVEQSFFLGGIATQIQFGEMNSVKKNSKDIYYGIVNEILQMLIEQGDGEYYLQIPMSSDPDIKVDRIRYNAEALKLILDRLLQKAGVKILFGCCLKTTTEQQDKIQITVGNRHSNLMINADIVIDGTGNAEIAYALGYPTVKPDSQQVQTATTAFHLTNVDIDRTRAFIASGALSQVIGDGFKGGYLPGKILSICPIPRTSTVAINATRAEHVDHESILDISRGVLESRGQISVMIPFIRERVDGMKNAVLSYISTGLGIRDRRRIEGLYTLTGHDLIELRQFDDAAAVGAYPIDIHDPVTKGVRFIDIDGVYQIPYSSMIPVGSKRLIVAGRAISADNEAFAALRMIPILSHLGEAAGHAAHLALRDHVPVDRISLLELRQMQHIDLERGDH